MNALKSKKALPIMFILTLTLIFLSFNGFAEDGYNPEEGWKIPPPVKKIKNPVKPDKKSLMLGKVVWDKNCASCHGDKGKGDGSKSKDLDSDPGDFSTAAFQNLPDGAIFFMTMEGKDEMKAFKKKLNDKQVWQVIHYIREFKK